MKKDNVFRLMVFVLVLSIIVLSSVNVNALSQLNSVTQFSDIDINRVNYDNGFWDSTNKILYMVLPSSTTIGKYYIFAYNSTSDTIQKSNPVLSTSITVSGTITSNGIVKMFQFNSTHVLLVIIVLNVNTNYQAYQFIVAPYYINSKTLAITPITTQTNTYFSDGAQFSGGFSTSQFYFSDEFAIDFYNGKIFIVSLLNIGYYYTSGGYFVYKSMIYVNIYDLIANAFNTYSYTLDTNNIGGISNAYYFLDFVPFVDANGYWRFYSEIRNKPNNLFYKVHFTSNGNTFSVSSGTTSSFVGIKDVNSRIVYGIGSGPYLDNTNTELIIMLNYPDTIQFSGTVLSYYFFDSYLQTYNKVSQDVSNLANSELVTVQINFQLGTNYVFSGYTGSFTGYLKSIYLYNPTNYYLKILTYNYSSNTLYSNLDYSTDNYAQFVFRVSYSFFYITATSTANTIKLYGNMVTTPTITITGTGGLGATNTYIAPSSQMNFIDVSSLVLVLIVFLLPVFLVYQYTNDMRLSLVSGLTLGFILALAIGLVPVWVLIIIVLGIVGIIAFGRGVPEQGGT